jgi:hypothetical protein
MLDQSVPLIDARMELLPIQQRKLIHFISQQAGAVKVVDIADNNRISQQTVSGQLKKLRDSGLVKSTKVGREAYYEIADPMMRMTLTLKPFTKQHTQENLAFLHLWFAARAQDQFDQDGQRFVFDRQWLLDTHTPAALPLHISLQPLIDSHLTALSNGEKNGFCRLLEKLGEISDSLRKPQHNQMHDDHLDLMQGLIFHNLEFERINNAVLLCQEMFNFAQCINSEAVWKHLCQLSIGITAMFAVLNKIEEVLTFVDQLEKVEPRLGSLSFTIDLSCCLVNKAKGYSRLGDKNQTLQTLAQLKSRADKRNSSTIAGTYNHAVHATIEFICSRDGQVALKLYKQVKDISRKYYHHGLLFSCTARLWTAMPSAMPLDQLIDMLPTVAPLGHFNHEVYLILQVLAKRSGQTQIGGQNRLWQKMVELQRQAVFAAGLIQVAITLGRELPQMYASWMLGNTDLLNSEVSLQHTKTVLLAIQDYLESDKDILHLLILPKEQRTLIVEALKDADCRTQTQMKLD